VFQRYEREKKKRWMYDRADIVQHIFKQLKGQRWPGVPIHLLYRDEVQDFVQGEMLLDLR
jgi:hypothetical protein